MPTMSNQGCVPSHLSRNQPAAQNAATEANSVMPAAYANPVFRFSSGLGGSGTISAPRFARQVIFGYFVEQSATRVAH
jgi:hypothetical protein